MNFDLLKTVLDFGVLGVLMYIIYANQKERQHAKDLDEKERASERKFKADYNTQLFDYMEIKNNSTQKVAKEFSESMKIHNEKANERHIEMATILRELANLHKR